MTPGDDGLMLGAGPDDCARLAAIHARCFATPWDEGVLSDIMRQAGVFVIHMAQGFVLCRVVLDEAEILTLAVEPESRGLGLGRKLVEGAALMAAEQGAERLFLEVAEDNHAARHLYAACDFREDGRRRGYYARKDGSTIDALLLSRNLS